MNLNKQFLLKIERFNNNKFSHKLNINNLKIKKQKYNF